MKPIATIVLPSLLVPALLLVLLPGLAPPAAAQEGDTDSFDGRIVLGFRSVDVGGTETKFREDVNQSDGPRLMDLDFELTPEGTARALADRIVLDVDDFGDDPFESMRLSVDKFGTYSFSYDRWESEYFYQDIILPPQLADVSLSSGGDFHHFDFERVRDRAQLDVTLSPRAELDFGFNRFTKRGESTTTLDVSRDEFELDKPVDEELFEYRAGFEYSWDRVTLVLDERYSEYENLYEIFLPGFSLGEGLPPDNLTSLDFFFLDQPYEYESWDHTLRLIARPTDRWIVRASGTLQQLSLDVNADERSQGVDFTGAPFQTDQSGTGEIDRDADLFDLDLTYLINDRFAVVGGYYYRNLDQEGEFTFGGALNEGVWDIETSGFEAGLEVTVSAELVVTGGLRYETRDVTFGAEEDAGATPLETEEESTDHDGYFANIAWRPTDRINLTLDYEDDSFDDPFTLSSPTDRSRIRARGRFDLGGGFWGTASYLLTDYENDNSGWDASTEQILGRVGYRADRLEASVGYSAVELERFSNFDVITLPGFGGGQVLDLPPRDYLAESDFIDGLLRYRVTDALSLGGEARLYENDGSFGIERDDFRVFGEYRLASGLLYRVAYRTVDYDETEFDFDDYDADVYDFGVGFTW